MLKDKIVRFEKIYKFYFDHFLIKCTVFVLIVKNVYGKSSAKHEYRDENVFLKVDRTLSKLITLFKSRSSDIVLLKLGNLHQNAKRYEARNTKRETRRPLVFLIVRSCQFFSPTVLTWIPKNNISFMKK